MNRFPSNKQSVRKVPRTSIVGHASGAVVPRRQHDAVEFLTIRYTIQGETSIKMIMGTGEGNESPEDTLIREFGEEAIEPIGPKVPGPFRCEYYLRPIVYTNLKEDDHNERAYHLQIFQLISLVSGKLRTTDMVDASKRTPVLLSPPEWIEAKMLIEMMMADMRTKLVHLKAVQHGLVHLCGDRRVSDRYADVVRDVELFKPQSMVLEYLKRFT